MKQEFEKQDEMKRSAMRAVAALLAIPDAGKQDKHHPKEGVVFVRAKFP